MQEPSLPRKRKLPSHLEVESSTGYYHSTPKELYHQQYFECLDLIITAVRERFDQPGYAVVLKLELLLKYILSEARFQVLSCRSTVRFSLIAGLSQMPACRLAPLPVPPWEFMQVAASWCGAPLDNPFGSASLDPPRDPPPRDPLPPAKQTPGLALPLHSQAVTQTRSPQAVMPRPARTVRDRIDLTVFDCRP